MTHPLVIAHLIATNFYGGPEKQIATHALRLDAERFRFTLFSFIEYERQNELVGIARSQGTSVVELHTGNPFNPRSIRQVADALKQHQVDLLCVHGYKANVIGRLASWLVGIPQISISRGWTAENPRIRFYEKLDRLFLRFTNHIVAVSHGQKKKILQLGISTEKISVIHNAINLENSVKPPEIGLRQQLGLPSDALVIASAGRLSPEKNYATMIEVARQICSSHPQAYFMVFGEGFLRPELAQKIESAGLQGRFLLPGFRKDLQSLLPEIDIFMLPSFTEGLPNVALEAFANKKPIVASAVGGTPEVVQHGVSGFLTTPEDVAGMVAGIQQLIADPGLRGKMGAAGYQYVAEYFDFAAQTAIYEKLYETVLKGHR